MIHKGYEGSHFDYLGHSSVNEVLIYANWTYNFGLFKTVSNLHSITKNSRFFQMSTGRSRIKIHSQNGCDLVCHW